MKENDGRASLGRMIAANLPGRRQKLKIWAIRSVIVLALAYLLALRGPNWLIWVAWAYVALTLVTAFAVTRGAPPGAGTNDKSNTPPAGKE